MHSYLTLPGAVALSEHQLRRLLVPITALEPKVVAITARYWYYVDAEDHIGGDAQARLADLREVFLDLVRVVGRQLHDAAGHARLRRE